MALVISVMLPFQSLAQAAASGPFRSMTRQGAPDVGEIRALPIEKLNRLGVLLGGKSSLLRIGSLESILMEYRP
jgi:hypothetical protein